ncbi:hypothetical protein B0H63DRAFT_480731 [Podospora didyma]|uniref:Uncharacterized protein n=1 Tax=Podospora didyma TaxID=330526 RepID=A0AAE0KEF8_9PEZI|nr:hypothetical protein B0H63DRAFT_480731 [Podospora didyma]
MAQDFSEVVLPEMISFTAKYHHSPYPLIAPTRPELSAAGKNVVVTGGGTGIGKSIATAFARAGAKSVSILGRRTDRLESAKSDILAAAAAVNSPTKVLTQVADLTVRNQVDAAFSKISSEEGKIHILVSNAGTMPPLAPLAGYPEENMQQVFANVMSTFNAIQAWLPHRSETNPTLLNISSNAAHVAPLQFQVGAYSAAKAASLKLVDYLAAENPGLHVVNVQPGTIATDMVPGAAGVDSIDLPGAFCVWLASPEAKFLRGKFVWANWDAEELLARADEIKNSRLLTWLIDGVPM